MLLELSSPNREDADVMFCTHTPEVVMQDVCTTISDVPPRLQRMQLELDCKSCTLWQYMS